MSFDLFLQSYQNTEPSPANRQKVAAIMTEWPSAWSNFRERVVGWFDKKAKP